MDRPYPKPYESFSGYKLWKSSPKRYRAKYYNPLESISFSTPETRFGKLIAEELEKCNPVFTHIPRYECNEFNVEVEIDGKRVFGRLDSFCPKRIRFLDDKTGHATSKGKPPWTKSKVMKWEQLVFYSMLLKEKFGRVDNVCHLVWLETKKSIPIVEYNGFVFENNPLLELTGKIKKFRRVIRQKERDWIRNDLLRVINEISEDYQKYLNENEKTNK